MSDLLRPETTIDLADGAAALLEVLRAAPPLTHCITNTVVTGFTANVLLALGAAPAMVDIVDEAGTFAGVASGLLINLGTPTPEQRAASREAVAGATASGTPWVLDPVAIGALPVRTALAHELVEQRPAAVRGNASEILALAGLSTGGRGVDSTDSTEAAADAAAALARRTGAVVAVSGPIDLITDGARTLRVANGHELLTRVTGGGCALGAVMAAFLGAARATEHDDLTAVAAAGLVYTIAAERAAATSSGPGSFAVALLDALAAVTADDIRAAARVEVVAL
ncbi:MULTISPECIES: hydroxyethylthiazole kinase [unclassified Microbacterium]|uniref:hydroxyethylthiazole kinase n=1 Tax=unclassified Microbacterium TaxID=2609290 RepID=UPI0016053696|nr:MULTISPECIES: hydroxyethylthiazole kinase [unclassified Microbacterium]QNA93034.1 hydroxyethylthiazole kinase [Microbacterium sp. Se63.02b]QYM63209.1 hydroxyethylthiazole kinase [Microbacterium sp. Se5.02b]